MAHVVAILVAIVIAISFELFTLSSFTYNCEKEIIYKNNIKICIISEETFANAFVNNNSLRNNDTIIFTTKKLNEEFENGNISKEEFEAIIEHELNHLRKKHYLFIPMINFVTLFVFILFILEVFVVIIKSIFSRKYSVIEFILLLILFASNHLVNYSVNAFAKKLEFEADNVSNEYKKHLVEALIKLSRINNTPLHFEGEFHPSAERRVQRLLEER